MHRQRHKSKHLLLRQVPANCVNCFYSNLAYIKRPQIIENYWSGETSFKCITAMFLPSQTLAFGLIVIAMFFWGSWTFIRSFCAAETPVFCQLYFLAQILTAFFFCVTLGDAQNTDNSKFFNDVQFSTELLHAGSGGRIMAILIGGHLNAHADFLCAVACSKLPFGVAFPVYAGWGLAQGTILNFIVLGMPGKAGFLFGGVICAIAAIFQLAWSDSFDKKREIERDDAGSNAENPLQAHSAEDWRRSDSQDAENAVPATSAREPPPSEISKPEDTNRWIYLCVFAGMLNGLWSPLASLGTLGDGAVKNPFVSLFLFQCGQFSAIPVFLNYIGMGKLFAPHYLSKLINLAWKDVAFGLAAGVLAGAGFTMYFVASSVISPAISFSIGACCPIFTIFLGVIFAKQLSGASWGKCGLLLGSVICYIVAIVLIASSKD